MYFRKFIKDFRYKFIVLITIAIAILLIIIFCGLEFLNNKNYLHEQQFYDIEDFNIDKCTGSPANIINVILNILAIGYILITTILKPFLKNLKSLNPYYRELIDNVKLVKTGVQEEEEQDVKTLDRSVGSKIIKFILLSSLPISGIVISIISLVDHKNSPIFNIINTIALIFVLLLSNTVIGDQYKVVIHTFIFIILLIFLLASCTKSSNGVANALTIGIYCIIITIIGAEQSNYLRTRLYYYKILKKNDSNPISFLSRMVGKKLPIKPSVGGKKIKK